MRYRVGSIKYDGGDHYETLTHGQYHDYQDAVAAAGQETQYHTFIDCCEEIWNSSKGELVHPQLFRKICHLTPAQHVDLSAMVHHWLEVNEEARENKRLENKSLPA